MSKELHGLGFIEQPATRPAPIRMGGTIPLQTESLSRNAEKSRWVERGEWETNFGAIVISGRPGSGSSSLARRIAKRYSIPYKSTGDDFRELADRPVIGDVRIDVDMDRALDFKLIQDLKQATVEEPVVKDAKYGGILATEVIEELGYNDLNPIVTVFVGAKRTIRVKRIFDREKERNPEIEITKEQAHKETLEREEGLRKKLGELHPQHEGIDIFVSHARNKEGRLIYMIHLSSTHTSEEELEEALHNKLVEIGRVRNLPKAA